VICELILVNKIGIRAGGMAQAVEHQLSKHKVLSSAKKKKKKKKVGIKEVVC
jgi:methylmalonyl-CoA mutase N-terminal domain/subunit